MTNDETNDQAADASAPMPEHFPEPAPSAVEPQPIRPRLLSVEDIARACHANNRAYCLAIGENNVLGAWEDLSDDLRNSITQGVLKHLEDPTISPEQSHELWMESKAAQGYTYGPVRDEAKKLHPCMVPYSDLPAAQRVKDYLFGALVRALSGI